MSCTIISRELFHDMPAELSYEAKSFDFHALVEDLFVRVKPAHSCVVASLNILCMCAINR